MASTSEQGREGNSDASGLVRALDARTLTYSYLTLYPYVSRPWEDSVELKMGVGGGGWMLANRGLVQQKSGVHGRRHHESISSKGSTRLSPISLSATTWPRLPLWLILYETKVRNEHHAGALPLSACYTTPSNAHAASTLSLQSTVI